ncbi:glycosyltransferase family 2 protein [Longispora urticae]
MGLTPAGTPLVSVVVPVSGRRGELTALLDSLAAQDRVRDLEVVVVDNPRPDNRAWLEAGDWPFPLRYHHLSTGNPGLARNVGAERARADWLLFLDSDIVLSPGAVGDLLAAARGSRHTVVMADVLFPPGEPRTLATHLLDVAAVFRGYRRARSRGPLGFREFVSCAFLVGRAGFAATGGFSPGFVDENGDDVYGYEDVEFALRAGDAGLAFELTRAKAYHHKRLDPALVLDYARQMGRTATYFVHLHPDIEQRLPLGVADTVSGVLDYRDRDVDLLLARAEDCERRWRDGDHGPVRELVAEARAAYREIQRYGRFAGISTQLATSGNGVNT